MYASITSIPSRLDKIKPCIDSLLNQTVKFTQIFLTIPLCTLRKQNDVAYQIPDFLTSSPYKESVTIVRPDKDYGPIMKFIGATDFMPCDSLVFVGDDDQMYHSTLVERLLQHYLSFGNDSIRKINNNIIITSRGYKMFLLWQAVTGYAGILLSSGVCKIIKNEVQASSNVVCEACQLVDDNWVGLIADKNNIKIISMDLEHKDIFVLGEPGDFSDGLNHTTSRHPQIAKCIFNCDTHGSIFFVSITILLFVIIVVVIVLVVIYLIKLII